MKGEVLPQNRPGARSGHSMVISPSGAQLYIFSGFGYGTTASGMLFSLITCTYFDGFVGSLNDLWALSLRPHGGIQKSRSTEMSITTNTYHASTSTVTSKQPTKPRTNGSFWIENMPIALTIMGALWVFMFELGCVAGVVYERKYGKMHRKYEESTYSTTSTTSSTAFQTDRSSSMPDESLFTITVPSSEVQISIVN